ncbi:MAG: MlaD family protein [Porphyromonadaceae bacterium]|nr:MlaD family protein [Porphyromonadaceae bacterium]
MKFKKEIKIGLVTLMALTLGYVGLNFLKGIDLFKKESIFYTKFENLNGVANATPVMISGYKVGAVRKVDFIYMPGKGYGATLTLALDPSVQIPKGSQLNIKKNMLTGSILTIETPDVQPGYFVDLDTIPSVEAPADLIDVATEKLVPAVEDVIPHLMATLERLNEILGNKGIDATLTGLQGTTAEMQNVVNQLSTSMNQMPQIMGNVLTASKSMVEVGRNAEEFRIDSVIYNVNAMTTNLRILSEQLRNPNSTAGLLINDDRLYNRLDSLANSADELMKDLKTNPKRYVHFSIF